MFGLKSILYILFNYQTIIGKKCIVCQQKLNLCIRNTITVIIITFEPVHNNSLKGASYISRFESPWLLLVSDT